MESEHTFFCVDELVSNYELLSSVDCNVGSGKYGEGLSNPSILSNCTRRMIFDEANSRQHVE